MTNHDTEVQDRLELALSAAREAGRFTLEFFQRDNFQVERKADDSPVTEADRGAEQLLRRKIVEAFPHDGILGEEYGEQAGSSGYRWILDPIDGTKSFISGVPLYATLVGVEYETNSVIGVIDVPGLDECVYAASGHGAWYVEGDVDPRPARVSTKGRLADGLFVTSQVDSFEECGVAEVYRALEKTAYITRTWGDAYGYLLVATGRAELMVDPIMNLWDAAPLQPVLEEAGGAFTDWQGRPTIHGGNGIGCNRHVLEEVLAITRPCARASQA